MVCPPKALKDKGAFFQLAIADCNQSWVNRCPYSAKHQSVTCFLVVDCIGSQQHKTKAWLGTQHIGATSCTTGAEG
eukprot:3592345-Amphidinium_carterae.1